MRYSLLPLLACPGCGGDLKFVALARHPRENAPVEEGVLGCVACASRYPIIGGIPRLRPATGTTRDAERTVVRFGWEWLRYPGSRPLDQGIFLDETMLVPDDLSGKLVLDAGCGMGRYSAVALSLGAEVVALDASESLLRVAERAKSNDKLHPVEGDLLRPPFKKEIFDVVYSQGVLHHTADTRRAFGEVAKLAKKGGVMTVWLYGKAGRFEDFATNPIRTDRAWIERRRRLAWGVVLVRHVLSDLLRVVTTRLPVPVAYALSYPLAVLGAIPGLRYLTFSVDPDFRARVIENFDWISPPYQWHHTKEELALWFQEEGFAPARTLPHGLVPKPGILGRKNR